MIIISFWKKMCMRLKGECCENFPKHPPSVYTFFKNWLWSLKIFAKKSWKLSPFKSMLVFLARQLFIIIFFFLSFSSFFLSFPLFKLLSFVHFLSFFSFSLWKGHADEGAHYLLTSNHKVNEKTTWNGKSQKKRWRNNWEP